MCMMNKTIYTWAIKLFGAEYYWYKNGSFSLKTPLYNCSSVIGFRLAA